MYVTPRKAIDFYKVSENTLRTWANTGKIKYFATKGGHRRYLLPNSDDNSTEPPVVEEKRAKIIYARVSSRKQRGDLEQQTKFLQQKYPEHTVVSDTGSGINFQRAGFKRILEGVFSGNIQEVVVAQKDRFSRFGYSLFEWIFQQHNAKLICDNNEEKSGRSPSEELSEDLLSIITVFSSRYYGKRKYVIAKADM
jgi:putative resolvase